MKSSCYVTTIELVDRALEAGGADVSERIRVRSLNRKGVLTQIADYPKGQAGLDEAARLAAASGQWFEEARALLNHSWAASEARDLHAAVDYAQRAVATAVSHELPGLETYSAALHARALELLGEWGAAEDLARDQLDASPITRMVALPIVGVIEARSGRDSAAETLAEAWAMAVRSDEYLRMAPAAIALAEFNWIVGAADNPTAQMTAIMERGLEIRFLWSTGALALWLRRLGELTDVPQGIAEPYRLVMEGEPSAAAGMFAAIGCTYDSALALLDGDASEQLAALSSFETMGAAGVATKVRKSLRDRGVAVPRGRGRTTRRHSAGLTPRQAEALSLMAEGLSNTEIADRLFLSPRTVEHHVAAVISKLNTSTRVEAVAVAREQGLLPAA